MATASGTRQHCDPDSFGKPIFQQTFINERNIRRFGLPGGYEGTSMAAPHVAAVAALIIATNRLGPNPTQRELEAHLKATAKPTDRPRSLRRGAARRRRCAAIAARGGATSS